jgi:non-canonical poly(A) RNA polymerase PAPD5/7
MNSKMATAATTLHGNWHDDDFLSFGGADHDEDQSYRAIVTKRPLPKQRQQAASPLPPWMTQPHEKPPGFRPINPMVALHNEIVDFCSLMEPRISEIQIREALVIEISEIISAAFSKKEECSVNLFGSQATGLFLPSSDIDLVVMVKLFDEKNDPIKDDESEWRAEKQSPLFRVAEALKDAWRDKLSYLEVIEQTRVPLVKCTHKPSGVSIDICFNQQTGVKAAALMTTFLKAMPPLRPLTFVLKYFTASRGLNEPYSGGIGSFLLQLLIVSFLQHRERDAINFRRPSPYNLGCLLVEFCELYGMDFNFVTTAISVRHDGYYFPKGAKDKREHFFQSSRPFSLAVENPLDTTMDVGKPSFRIHLVQRTLDTAFKVLRSHVTVPIIPSDSILKSILPLTAEMWERHKMVMADGNEDMWEGSTSDDDKEGLLTKRPMQKYNNDDMWGSDSDHDGEAQPVNKKARNKY